MARVLEALLSFIESRDRTPFAWGRGANDCASFMLDAIVAQGGADPFPGKTWANETEAARVIKRHGGLERAVTKRLRAIPPAMAQRGDVAGVPDERFGVSLMIVEGATLVAPGTRGNKRLPRSAMTKAWTIDV